MSQISFSRSSPHSPLKFLAILTVLAFMTCQTVCLSHCHSSEQHHFEHDHIPIGHRSNHESEYHQMELEIEGQSHTHLHEHSNIPHPIVPKKLMFWWPEIAVDITAVPAITATSRVMEYPFTGCTLSLIYRYGFTFIGRSPTVI